jgi:hypothetical protein
VVALHYCDIFSECYHCPVPFCPYEKLDDDDPGWDQIEEIEEENNRDNDQDEGW